MLLTIAIPTFNRPELLEESIKSAINQTTELNYEILISDNCSEKKNLLKIKQIIRNLEFQNIRLLENSENIGMYNNWNRCLEYSLGEYVTILNDDDLLDKNYVKEMCAYISGGRLIACRSSNFGDLQWAEIEKNNFLSKFHSPFMKPKSLTSKVGFREIFKGNPVSGSLGALFNRNEALRIGGFDIAMRMSADYDFYVRYSQNNEFIILNKTLGLYRYHDNETFKLGVLESFVDDTYIIRKKFCEYSLPNFTKPWYTFAINLHRNIQIRRYQKLFPKIFTYQTRNDGLVKAIAKINNINLLRIILYLIVSILSVLSKK
ncbi:glycosyltransferase family 2 protein [Polynucleobacter yangtzensis]|uniref:Glycosyltransferase 2-like domain-containing protein n=1 Tax=Polynucleobacter yangtzensis TaxID=1743159 RepID=A0ABM8CKT0_9BURK|nr:glycosyltransferase [Polynucleobacter yangtzensis]BDT78453.1 hypothetical protein PKF032_03410 [Polynucleobacter yangtzensis]